MQPRLAWAVSGNKTNQNDYQKKEEVVNKTDLDRVGINDMLSFDSSKTWLSCIIWIG